MLRKILVSVALCGFAAAPLAAQRQFMVGPRLGYTQYASETAIEAAPMLGVDAMYSLSRNLSFGVRMDFARPVTDGTYFPAEMTFGDTTMLFAVSQPITVLNYGVQAEFTTGGSFAPFVNGGVGGYRLSLDPQVAAGTTEVTETMFTVGGGISIQTSPGTSIRLMVQDIIYNNFNRANLNPVDARFAPMIFPDAIPPQAPFEGVAHNLHFALAFSFTPGGQ